MTAMDKDAQKRAIKIEYCRVFGEREEDTWQGHCQSCGNKIWMHQADFSHKVPAGMGGGGDKGGIVDPENGIFSCRACHGVLERSPLAMEMRAELQASPANMLNGLLVKWTPKIMKHLFKNRGKF